MLFKKYYNKDCNTRFNRLINEFIYLFQIQLYFYSDIQGC